MSFTHILEAGDLEKTGFAYTLSLINSLTECGKSLIPILDVLCEWGRANRATSPQQTH